jgi:hypothetical protein
LWSRDLVLRNQFSGIEIHRPYDTPQGIQDAMTEPVFLDIRGISVTTGTGVRIYFYQLRLATV